MARAGASAGGLAATGRACSAARPPGSKRTTATPTKQVKQAVSGEDSRLAELLNARHEFDFAPGPHGAKLWMLSSTCAEGERT